MNLDLVSFFLVVGLIAGAGGLIYWYARSVGGGVAQQAFEDPYDRKRVLVFGGIVIGITLVIFLGLVFTNVIKL